MLQENVSRCLRWVDSNPIRGNDSAGCRVLLELHQRNEVNAGTRKAGATQLTSSAAYFNTAVKGACSGTFNL